MDKVISTDLAHSLNSLRDALASHILGQEEVLADIVSLLQRAFCRMRFPGRPIASMLFLGPTGVGKTETCNLFTEHLFGSLEKLIRFDMSEYMTVDSIGVLRGQNIQERGLLGLFYDRSQGSGTILFDEIEKAHPLILDVFLQILSAGRFTLANGETLDLTRYVVVATSNIGSRMLMESRSTDRQTLIRRTLQASMTEMRPETYARFDLHCVFNKLDYLTLKRIAELHARQALEVINAQGHCVTCDPQVIEYVQREGYSEHFGARPVQTVAMRVIGQVVANEMLKRHGRSVQGQIGFDPVSNKTFFAVRDV
jgi:ATP-dependent Clp protease ATP-binding subunit ClpA